MKVAIITYTDANNPGAQLQAYALQETVSRIAGEKCYQIDHRKFDDKIFSKISGLGSIFRNVYYLIGYSQRKKRNLHYDFYRKNILNLTEPSHTDEKRRLLNMQFDAFITGSDQVWNCQKGLYSPFYLDFVEEGKLKFAYSASMGKIDVPSKYQQDFTKAISDFDAISVREKQVAEYLEENFDVNATVTCDPVFLLKKEEWSQAIRNAETVSKDDYIFVFTTEINDHMISVLKNIRRKTQYKVISTRAIPGVKTTVRLDIGPLEFVKYIANSKMVVTNSFHATAFSIIFQKDFYTVPHTSRASRLVSLLSLLDIEERLIFETNENLDLQSIDYDSVNAKLEQYVFESISYLKKCLNKS